MFYICFYRLHIGLHMFYIGFYRLYIGCYMFYICFYMFLYVYICALESEPRREPDAGAQKAIKPTFDMISSYLYTPQ